MDLAVRNTVPGAMDFSFSRMDFLKLTVPNTLSALSIPLAGLVGTMVIGQMGEAILIGAVALGSTVLSIVFFAFNFMRSGTLGLTAQAFGAADSGEQGAIALRSLLLAVLLGLLLIAGQGPLAQVGLSALGAEGEMRAAAEIYLLTRIWSAPASLVNFAVVGWVMGRSQAVLALALQLIGTGLNILMSIWLVLGLGWGVEGAALACVFAEYIAAGVGVAAIARLVRHDIGFSLRRMFDAAEVTRMLRVNGDIFVRSLFLWLALALFTRIGAGFGPVVLAANAILFGIFQTAAAGQDGISAASEQLVGRAIGARSDAAFWLTVRIAVVWGVALSVVLAAAVALLTPELIRRSTGAPDVIAAAVEYRWWVPLSLLTSSIAYQMDGIFVGAAWSRSMRNIMIACAAIFATSAYALGPTLHNHGLWASFVLFLVARGALGTAWMFRNAAAMAAQFQRTERIVG